jgi:hypothetical protein
MKKGLTVSNIKIIRLQSGGSIIATIEELVKDEFLLSEPMYFDVDPRGEQTHIVMSHFLPIQLVEKNEVVLNKRDFVYVVTPTEEFVEYYSNSVERLRKLFEMKEMDDEELQQSEEALDLIMKAFGNMDSDGLTKH